MAPQEATPPGAEPISILGVTNVVLRNRRLVFGIMLLVTVLAVAWKVTARRMYVASASFVPAGRKAASALTGLAAQFGVAVPGGDLQQSPDFYVALLHTRTVQDDVLDSSYIFEGPAGPYSGTLLDYYGKGDAPLAQRREAALRALDRQIETGTDLKTGVVRLAVRSFSPTLAADIARNLLAALDRFDRRRAERQSSLESEFMEAQVTSATADLRAAEDRLQTFQERNRDYNSAPELMVQYQRLVREVSMQQQLYGSVSLAYAQARMDAARDNPTVAILESPEPPPNPERRGLAKTGAIALLAGLALGLFVAFVREHVVRTRLLRPEENAEFAALRAATARDLRGTLRLLRLRRR